METLPNCGRSSSDLVIVFRQCDQSPSEIRWLPTMIEGIVLVYISGLGAGAAEAVSPDAQTRRGIPSPALPTRAEAVSRLTAVQEVLRAPGQGIEDPPGKPLVTCEAQPRIGAAGPSAAVRVSLCGSRYPRCPSTHREVTREDARCSSGCNRESFPTSIRRKPPGDGRERHAKALGDIGRGHPQPLDGLESTTDS
jgi:hypothetical protein